MRTHRITAIGCLLAVLLFVSGCGSLEGTVVELAAATASGDTTESGEPTYVFPSDPEEGGMTVDFAEPYTGISELCDEADVVIIGRIYLQEFDPSEGSHYSYAQVWVEESIIGGIGPQTMLTIRELGTRYGNGTVGTVNHVPLLRSGERVLLFLKGPVDMSDPWKTGYSLAGDYHGKFFYKQEEDTWYAAGLLGENASVLSDAAEPIPDEELWQLLDSSFGQNSTESEN